MQPAVTPRIDAPPRHERGRSRLIWLGWTLGYALFCAAAVWMVDLLIGRTTWFGVPLLLLWAAGSFGIGFLYRQMSWAAGPLVIGVAPLAAIVVWSIVGSPTTSEDGIGYGILGFMIVVIYFTAPMLLMSLAGAAGVGLGRWRSGASRVGPSPAAVSQMDPKPDRAPRTPMRQSPTSHVPPVSIPLQRTVESAAASIRTDGFASVPAKPAPRVPDPVEEILNSPMPRNLRRAAAD